MPITVDDPIGVAINANNLQRSNGRDRLNTA
jgi:hypothetical protein